MTTGEPHPAAKLPSFNWPGNNHSLRLQSTFITSSRFAILASDSWTPTVTGIVDWDWITGRVLLVSETFPLATAFRSTTIRATG